MSEHVALVHFHAAVMAERRQRFAAALRAAGHDALAGPVLPGAFNGGDLLWRARGGQDVHIDALLREPGSVAHIDGARFDAGRGGGEWTGRGVYRALLLSVLPRAMAHQRERFESELLAMPRYIGAIRGWRLSRVREATGRRQWTHVWEQEFASVDGLLGAYMLHPYHWAVVDRWFDPESPDWIVDPYLCHSFCATGDLPA